MRLSILTTFVCACVAMAAMDINIEFLISKFLGLDNFVPNNCHPVEGNVKFHVCDREEEQAVKIRAMDASVYPLPAGEDVEFEVVGKVDSVVQKGAFLNITIYAGLREVHNGIHPICDLLKEHKVGRGCPLKPTKKDIAFKRTITIPDWIPSSKYLILATVSNPDDSVVLSFSGQYEVKGTPETDARYMQQMNEENKREEEDEQEQEPDTVTVDEDGVKVEGVHAEKILEAALKAAGAAEALQHVEEEQSEEKAEEVAQEEAREDAHEEEKAGRDEL